MAKFTPGAIVSEISGKIAATIYTRNKGGNVIRNRRTPINRRSVGQSTVRQRLGNLAAGWRGLSAANRASWNAAAPNFPYQNTLGETKYLSGEQVYVQFNSNLLILGAAAVATAPSPFSFETYTIALTANTTPVLSLAFTPTPMTAFNNLAVYATPPLSAGIDSPNKSKFRLITTIAAAASSPANILTAYQNVFGTPPLGQKVFVEVRPIASTGQGGTPLRAVATVTAP
ncbi:MAG TPA: hypothetical protein PKE07_15405 [Lacibacter sp.]|nr:hypothetical protein [Lacibacter sp.]